MITVARVEDVVCVKVDGINIATLDIVKAKTLQNDLSEALKELPYWVHDGSQWYGPFTKLEFGSHRSEVVLHCISGTPGKFDLLGFYLNYSGAGKIVRSHSKPA